MQLYSIQEIDIWLHYMIDDFIRSLCSHSRLDLHNFPFIFIGVLLFKWWSQHPLRSSNFIEKCTLSQLPMSVFISCSCIRRFTEQRLTCQLGQKDSRAVTPIAQLTWWEFPTEMWLRLNHTPAIAERKETSGHNDLPILWIVNPYSLFI